MNSKLPKVVCVMDVMQTTPEIRACIPRHIAEEYFMECVLLLIEHATSASDVPNQQVIAMEFLDETMADYDYEEAISRGMSDEEYLNWHDLIKSEILQCTLTIAQRMYPQIKPVLTTCAQIYPSGYVMDVQELTNDGLYADLISMSPEPPSNTNG